MKHSGMLMIAIMGLGVAVLPGQPVHLSLEDEQEFLLTAKVIRSKAAPKGITASRRVTLSNGAITHDAHVQAINESKTTFQTDQGTELNFRDSYKYNVAAYRLACLLGIEGMMPVSVERKIDGNYAAVTWWVDDVLMDELQRRKHKVAPPNPERWNRQMYIVRVFDELIYNTDRNLGNLLIQKNWTLQMIDHTRAFRTRTDLREPKQLVQCDRALLSRMVAMTEGHLSEQLGRYLTRPEIRGLLARRDRIVHIFDQKVKEQGEAAVLYDYLPLAGAAR